ncbi:MAG: hypothetical protein RLZZ450_100 [Pseudomonadota bacterium]|jgi:hypothetical protein
MNKMLKWRLTEYAVAGVIAVAFWSVVLIWLAWMDGAL